MTPHPTLIIITGAPASGKTSLGNFLAQELALPMFSRDQLKETMFNVVGWKNRKLTDQVGIMAYRLLDHLIVTELEAGKSFIVESHFDHLQDSPRFLSWQKHYHFRCVQLVCTADHTVLLERFKGRAKSGGRHPGHRDTVNYKAFSKNVVADASLPLALKSVNLSIDTTDFTQVKYDKIVKAVRKVLER